jgi:hypothetical protein
MPTNAFNFRRWMGDHRLRHWDFWWWYLAHARLSPGASLLLGGIWLVVGLGLFVAGLRMLGQIESAALDAPGR